MIMGAGGDFSKQLKLGVLYSTYSIFIVIYCHSVAAKFHKAINAINSDTVIMKRLPLSNFSI